MEPIRHSIEVDPWEELVSRTETNRILIQIVDSIEISDSVYETAERRYQDFGSWLGRNESLCAPYRPHICPQGSFRLGTVIRPIHQGAEYDLDLGCNLEEGYLKGGDTQEALKALIGAEVEQYRIFRRIVEPKVEKHRCWRLPYTDELKFHLDIVPCVPESSDQRRIIRESMMGAGLAKAIAETIDELTMSITDDRHPRYRVVTQDWYVSSPEGYARWFESRMRLASSFLEKRLLEVRAAKVDDLPAFRWKTPLQRCVQLLKRHRDVMFADNLELAPISIILTTLAARLYNGESDLTEALRSYVDGMEQIISRTAPRIPNPVNPREDFADKWNSAEGRRLRLEDNFHAWLSQVRADLTALESSRDPDFWVERVEKRFAAKLNVQEVRALFGFPTPIVRPAKT